MGTSISTLKFQDKCLRREPSTPPPPCVAHHPVRKLCCHGVVSGGEARIVSVGCIGKCYRRARHDSGNSQPSLLSRLPKQKSTNNFLFTLVSVQVLRIQKLVNKTKIAIYVICCGSSNTALKLL